MLPRAFPPRREVSAVPIRCRTGRTKPRWTPWRSTIPLDLTGSTRAVPLGERVGLAMPPTEPEMIYLYRLPILFEWCERGCTLEDVVFDVLTHEIGHHFGMDETAVLRMEGRDARGVGHAHRQPSTTWSSPSATGDATCALL